LSYYEEASHSRSQAGIIAFEWSAETCAVVRWFQCQNSSDGYFATLAVSGRARFQAGDQQQQADPGMLIFVERMVEHRFFDITEDLTVLVFFAPSERLA
jgi:hypothetical protein